MKRKLSALLAIVLVAVMVFPTAIFVGAADATEITISYVGSDGNTVNVKNGDTIYVPVRGSVQLQVSATGYTVEGKRNGDEDGKVTFTQSTNTFTGNAVNGAGTSFTYTATATGKEALSPVTFTVVCELPEITTAGVGVISVNGSTTDYSSSRNLYTCATGTAIKSVELSGMLNNGNAATFNYELSLDGSDYDSFDKAKGVVVNTKNKTLYVKYEAKDTDGNIVETNVKEVFLDVTGHDIKSVYVEGKKGSVVPMEGNSITATEFVKYIDVYMETTDGYSKKIPDGYKIEFSNLGGTSSITKDNFEAATFTVSYGGITSVSYPAMDFITFDLPEIATDDIVATLSLKNNMYIEGQKASTTNEVNIKVVQEGKDITKDVTIKDVTVSPFVYNQNYITISCKINGVTFTKSVDLPAGVTIEKKTVVSIAESSKSKMKKTYTAGDKLDLSGLLITLTYNNGETEDLDYNVKGLSYSPTNGKELTADDKSVRVSFDIAAGQAAYTDIAITVTKSSSITVKEVILVSEGKKDYYLGDKFDGSEYKLYVTYTNEEINSQFVYLSSCSPKIEDSTKYTSSSGFKKEFNGSLTVTFTLPSSVETNGKSRTLILDDVSVEKRPTLESITATPKLNSYMDGDSLRVCDFVITVKYDNKDQNVINLTETTTDATKSTYTSPSADSGISYTIKLSPTTVDASSKTVRVTYSEKLSGSYTSTSKYDDVEITVTVPDAVLTYYDTTEKTYVSKAYIDFEDALKAANEIVRSNNSFTTSYYNRVPEIQLRRDVTMTSDWPVSKDLIIDLNGHSLTMIRGEVYVASTAGSDIVVTFTNDDKNDAKLIYSTSDDDTIILGEDDTFTIDKTTRSDVGKYDVTISFVKNGKVDGPREVTHGHDAKFTITPDEDYKIKSISVKEDKATKKYTEKDGVVTVEDVQGALTITVTFEEKAWDNPFTDVYKSATYYKSIQFVYENGLFSGMSATKFEPDTTMTRAMFVTVLGRLANVDTSKYTKAPSFTDVSTTDQSISYAIPYIQWATEKGLITGYGNGKFGPKDNITHIQMYVLMQRYAGYIEHKNTDATSTSIPANDVSDIPTWAGAKEAVQYAAKYDFLVTSSNRITPNNNAKRSELAVLLDKFCENVLEWEK